MRTQTSLGVFGVFPCQDSLEIRHLWDFRDPSATELLPRWTKLLFSRESWQLKCCKSNDKEWKAEMFSNGKYLYFCWIIFLEWSNDKIKSRRATSHFMLIDLEQNTHRPMTAVSCPRCRTIGHQGTHLSNILFIQSGNANTPTSIHSRSVILRMSKVRDNPLHSKLFF